MCFPTRSLTRAVLTVYIEKEKKTSESERARELETKQAQPNCRESKVRKRACERVCVLRCLYV